MTTINFHVALDMVPGSGFVQQLIDACKDKCDGKYNELQKFEDGEVRCEIVFSSTRVLDIANTCNVVVAVLDAIHDLDDKEWGPHSDFVYSTNVDMHVTGEGDEQDQLKLLTAQTSVNTAFNRYLSRQLSYEIAQNAQYRDVTDKMMGMLSSSNTRLNQLSDVIDVLYSGIEIQGVHELKEKIKSIHDAIGRLGGVVVDNSEEITRH